jgi:protein gp37
VSPGCDHCYAEAFTHRFAGVPDHPFTTGFTPTVHQNRMGQPLHWRSPRRVFVGALGDLFHDDVPDETIAEVWAVMSTAHWHTFQVLTKRHARMRSLLNDVDFRDEVCAEVATLAHEGFDVVSGPNPWQTWPLHNVWVGVSAETQQWADIRIPALLDTPAALRWVSAEPLLGMVDLGLYLRHLDWVVVGGESGAFGQTRNISPLWVETIINDCAYRQVPVFVKLGSVWARHHGLTGRGADPDQWPPELRIRQFPPDAATTAQVSR